jgi:hypothetical protein
VAVNGREGSYSEGIPVNAATAATVGEDGRELSELEQQNKEKKDEASVNLHFAMHIYFAEKAVQVAALVGPATLWAFGLCAIGSVNPAAVGAGVFLVSVSFGCWSYAVSLAQGMNWRLNDQVK